jgi:hypothetical protein
MIRGIHAMFYSSSPEELRGFLGAKLGLKSFDIGGGWLVFDLPEAEVACHGVDSDKGRNSGAHYNPRPGVLSSRTTSKTWIGGEWFASESLGDLPSTSTSLTTGNHPELGASWQAIPVPHLLSHWG